MTTTTALPAQRVPDYTDPAGIPLHGINGLTLNRTPEPPRARPVTVSGPEIASLTALVVNLGLMESVAGAIEAGDRATARALLEIARRGAGAHLDFALAEDALAAQVVTEQSAAAVEELLAAFEATSPYAQADLSRRAAGRHTVENV